MAVYMMTKNYDTKIATMAQDIDYIKNDINELKQTTRRIESALDNNYVKKNDLKFLYGVLSTVATAVILYGLNYFLSLLNT